MYILVIVNEFSMSMNRQTTFENLFSVNRNEDARTPVVTLLMFSESLELFS